MEHTVTEEAFGVDLVRLQFALAGVTGALGGAIATGADALCFMELSSPPRYAVEARAERGEEEEADAYSERFIREPPDPSHSNGDAGRRISKPKVEALDFTSPFFLLDFLFDSSVSSTSTTLRESFTC